MSTKTATKAASKRAAANRGATEPVGDINVPKTTAAPFAEDVQKVAIVSGAEQPIDEKATREQLEIDRAQTEAREFANSPAGRLAASPLMFIDDPQARKRYVGVPPAEGELSVHGTPAIVLIKVPLSQRAPESGLMVYPEAGEPFAVKEGQREWIAVVNDDGEPLIGAVSKAEAQKAATATKTGR